MLIDKKNIMDELKRFEFPEESQRQAAVRTEKEKITAEQAPERIGGKNRETAISQGFNKEGQGPESASLPAVSQPIVPARQMPNYFEVEKILEDNLAEIFQGLTPVKKQEFKVKGEIATKQIAGLLNSTKISFLELSKKIFHLIIDWLRIIPGVNKYFLEQEAKIKADKILTLRNNQPENFPTINYGE